MKVDNSQQTRYFVASSYEHIQTLSQMDSPAAAAEFIFENFKEVDPGDLTVGEWQSLLLSGLLVGTEEGLGEEGLGQAK